MIQESIQTIPGAYCFPSLFLTGQNLQIFSDLNPITYMAIKPHFSHLAIRTNAFQV